MKDKELITAWKYVEKIAKKYGYICSTHNDVYFGAGTTMYKKDKFVPIIILSISWDPGVSNFHDSGVALHVEDRNGNDIITGTSCAIYILTECEDFEDKLKKMCIHVFDKYSKYSRENRLDFAFNNLEYERIKWNEQ